jgi:hypothetical protein
LSDEDLIEKARSVSLRLIEDDPTLSSFPTLAHEVSLLKAEESSDFLDKG